LACSISTLVVRWNTKNIIIMITFTFTYLIKDVIKKTVKNIKYMFWFYLQFLSEIFFILRRIQRDIIKNVSRSSCKVLVIVVRFLWKLSFLDSFSRYKKISNFIKIRLVGTKLFHADGRTDMTNLIDAFCNFANEPDYKMVLANFYFFC